MIFRSKERMRQYWKKLMNSTQEKLSRGSLFLSRVISWPRGESWRRNDKVQRGHDHHKK